MRRFPVLSFMLWSSVGCGSVDGVGHLPDAPPPPDASQGPDAGIAQTDLPGTGAAVAFGDADCGSTPAPKMLAFHNTGNAPLTWNATIEGTGFAIGNGASGTVQPGDTGAIAITPAMVPATATVGQPITATLKIATNAAAEPFQVALSVVPHGGALQIATPSIGFGQAQLTDSVSQDLQISNTGDRAIEVALGQPTNADFTASWGGAPAAAALAPGAALSGALAGFRPTMAGVEQSTAFVRATGPVCAGDAPTIALTGEGTTAQVTVTPGTLQFGTTACGQTARAKQVTIQNAYDFAIHYTAAILSGPYAIASGQATGSVPASGTATITVTANSVPAAPASLATGALAGTMTVTTDAPAASPASLTMAQVATGAVLALTPAPGATIAFGGVAAGAPASMPYSVKNTGNAAAAVTVQVTGSGFTASTPGGGTVPATGSDTAATVTQTVVQRGALTGTLALSTTTTLCQPAAPGAVALTATGKAAVASVGTAPAMVALCGVATPPSVNVAVQNTGDEPLVIASATATGGFAVTSTLPLTIQPGASGNLAVRPPAAQVGTDVAGTAKTGTLSFATNEIGNPTRNVALSSTVTGASLSITPAPGSTIAFGDVNAGTPASQSYSVKNTGNLAATVTVTATGPGFSATVPGGGTIPAGGASQSATVTQTVAQHGAVTGSLTVSSTTAQCTAAPGGDPLSAFGRTPTAVIGQVPAMSATCGGGTPAAVSVPISNTGDGPLVVNASATGGFTITSALPITIAPGAASAIIVQPPAAVIGSDVGGTARTGTLTATTNELSGATHPISLSSTVVGANLVLTDIRGTPITTATFNATQSCPAPQTITIRNTGNAPASIAIATANFQLFKFGDLVPGPGIAGGAAASHALGVFTVQDLCTGTETVQYTATGSICTMLPLTLQASFNIGGQSSCFCS